MLFLDHFYLSLELPAEIHLVIWEITISGCRVNFEINRAGDFNLITRNHRRPATIATCCESRLLALYHFTTVNVQMHGPRRIWIAPRLDTISVPAHQLYYPPSRAEFLSCFIPGDLSLLHGRERLKICDFPWYVSDFSNGTRINDLQSWISCLRHLYALRKLHIITIPRANSLNCRPINNSGVKEIMNTFLQMRQADPNSPVPRITVAVCNDESLYSHTLSPGTH